MPAPVRPMFGPEQAKTICTLDEPASPHQTPYASDCSHPPSPHQMRSGSSCARKGPKTAS